MKSLLVFALILFSASLAHAADSNLKMNCVPAHSLEKALPVSWGELREVKSVQLVMSQIDPDTRIEIKTRILNLDQEEVEALDVYGFASMNNQTTLLRKDRESNGLRLDTVSFVVTDLKTPPSAGPVAPGKYFATATLVLVASHRKEPGVANVVETRAVDMDCSYVSSL